MEIGGLNSLRTSQAPVWRQVTHPELGPLSRKGEPIEWQFLSPVSEEMRAYQRELAQEGLDNLKRSKNGKIDLDVSLDELEERVLSALCRMVAGWRNFALTDGEDLPFSAANVRSVLSDPELDWLHDWAREQAHDRGNFRGASEKTRRK